MDSHLLCLLGMASTAIAAWTCRSLINAAAATRKDGADRSRRIAARCSEDLDRLAICAAMAADEDAHADASMSQQLRALGRQVFTPRQELVELGQTLLALRVAGDDEVAEQRRIEQGHLEALDRASELDREAAELLDRPLRAVLRMLRRAVRRG